MIISSKMVRQSAEYLRLWCVIHNNDCQSCDFYTGVGCSLKNSQTKIADRTFPWEKMESNGDSTSELKRNVKTALDNMRAAEDFEIAMEGIRDTVTGCREIDDLIEYLNESPNLDEFQNTLSDIYNALTKRI